MTQTLPLTDLELAQEAVLLFLNNIHPISCPLRSAIKAHSYLFNVSKKQKLLDIGETQRTIYFIIKGGVRSYYLDQAGNDITSWLLYDGDLAISVYSFFSQQSSFETLETLEDSTLLALNYKKLNELYNTHIEFNYVGRVLTEQYYIKSEEKANGLRMYTAKERYLDLLEKQPNIIIRTPLRIIASYLGVTKYTLSRIRAQI